MNRDNIKQELTSFRDGIAPKSVQTGFYKEVKKEVDTVLKGLETGSYKSDFKLAAAVGQMRMQVTVLENQWQTKLTKDEKQILGKLRQLTDQSKDEMLGLMSIMGMFR